MFATTAPRARAADPAGPPASCCRSSASWTWSASPPTAGSSARENLPVLLGRRDRGGWGLGAVTFRFFDESWLRLALGTIALAFVAYRYSRRAPLRAFAALDSEGPLLVGECPGSPAPSRTAGGPPLTRLPPPAASSTRRCWSALPWSFSRHQLREAGAYTRGSAFSMRATSRPHWSSHRSLRWASAWASGSCAAFRRRVFYPRLLHAGAGRGGSSSFTTGSAE
jgi:hypothetical protein